MKSNIGSLLDGLESGTLSLEQALQKIRALRRDSEPALQAPRAQQRKKTELFRFEDPLLRDHTVGAERVLVGTTHIALALRELFEWQPSALAACVRKCHFGAPAALAPAEQLAVSVELSAEEGDEQPFNVTFQRADNPPALGASGRIGACAAPEHPTTLAELRGRLQQTRDVDRLYDGSFVGFGPSFRIVDQLSLGTNCSLARLVESAESHLGRALALDPVLLSVPFTLAGATLLAHDSQAFLPFGLQQLRVKREADLRRGYVFVEGKRRSEELVLFDAWFFDQHEQLVAKLEGGSIKAVRPRAEARAEPVGVEGVQVASDRAPRTAISSTSQADRAARLRDDLLARVALRLGGGQKLDPTLNFMSMGLESAQLVQLTQELEQMFAIELEPTLFFEYPNVQELTSYLLREYGERLAPSLARPSRPEESEQLERTPLPQPVITAKKSERGETPAARARTEDIAVIGMSGQFAHSRDLDAFWINVRDGVDLMEEIPRDHWDYRPWFDPDREAKDKTYCKWGSFLSDIDKFDAAFFKISPREADWMDPQLRLLLQNVYTTAEAAGYIQRIRGTHTGVFVGVCSHDYADRIAELQLPVDPHFGTGLTLTVFANRISFLFDLKGPSLGIDTACSSSLFALHAACNALRNGECELALVAGVNLLLSSFHYRYFSSIGALSPTGRCHSFDEAADGYVPGEGVASILLKPLAQAIADGDAIHGVIKGSAALHGGYTPSLTAPSVGGEENVLVKAWQAAGISPETLSYIEAHGTGTKLGDPVEINALKRAFRQFTTRTDFCTVGSAKANLGHTEGAAGITGLVKVLLQMKHGVIPRMPHFRRLNPYIKLEQSALRINEQALPWRRDGDTPLRAGVSSFGFSGAYAHVVVEEYVAPAATAPTRSYRAAESAAIVLSARTPMVLEELVRLVLSAVRSEACSEERLHDIAYTLQCGREALPTRLAFSARSGDEFVSKLQAFLEGRQQAAGLFVSGEEAAREEASAVQDALERREIERLLALWAAGSDVDWLLLHADRRRVVALPTYPFAKRRHWLSELDRSAAGRELGAQPVTSPARAESGVKPRGIVLSRLPSEAPIASTAQLTRTSDRAETAPLAPVARPQADLRSDLALEPQPALASSGLSRELRASLAETLSLDPAEIDPQAKFVDMGLDSILAAEWARKLSKRYGVELAARELHEWPTLARLAERLASQARMSEVLPAQDGGAAAPAEGQHASPTPRIEVDHALRARIVQELRESLASTLSLEAADMASGSRFVDLGLDSILTAEWLRALNARYRLQLVAAQLHDHPTLPQLTEFVCELLSPTQPKEAAASPPRASVPAVEGATAPVGSGHEARRVRATVSDGTGEAIAIIALSGRFPGARDVEQFSENLRENRDCVREVPGERWDHTRYFQAGAVQPGKTNSKWGGFLDGVDEFDPLFFKLSPREAAGMDPKIRLFLQTAWSLIEQAGYTRASLAERHRSLVGVYVGAMYNHQLGQHHPDAEAVGALASYSYVANRVSYFLNLRGPSVALDTACSSSLVAVHEACEALRRGDCELAIAGGINLTITPKKYLGLSLVGMLGSDPALCRAFGDGDGFFPAEAVGAVLLKPLDAARRDGDAIAAVIRGSAVAHKGFSEAGFFAPDTSAIDTVMRTALRNAATPASTIGYVEAAANGLADGDEAEFAAMKQVFADPEQALQSCSVGSVKANIGHAEAASGISQLTKVVLQLRERALFPSIAPVRRNPRIDFENSPFRLQDQLTRWEPRHVADMDGKAVPLPRRALVTSVGAGGTSACAVLEEWPDEAPRVSEGASSLRPQIVVLSAKSERALRRKIDELASFLRARPTLALADVAYTLQLGREAMDVRFAVVATSVAELLVSLDAYSRGESSSDLPIYAGTSEGALPVDVAQPDFDDLHALAQAWTRGAFAGWSALSRPPLARRIALPSYPFERRRCWLADVVAHDPVATSIAEPRAAARDAVVVQVRSILCELLGLAADELRTNAPLTDYGLDSITAMTLIQQLQSRVHPDLSSERLMQCRSAEQIFDLVATTCEGAEPADQAVSAPLAQPHRATRRKAWPQFPELIALNDAAEGRPIFWMHAALGGVETYRGLARLFNRPFFGIQSRGWMTNRRPLRGIQAMVAYYAHIVQTIQPEGPYDLGGYSFGGALAYELARQLQELGQEVRSIVMLDTHDTVHTKQIQLSSKSELLQTVNTALAATLVEPTLEMVKQTLIHRDELDRELDDEAFLKQLVALGTARGLKKSEESLRELTTRSAAVQRAYEVRQFDVSPLTRPDGVACYYFRSRRGLFWNELEPFHVMSYSETPLDRATYWREWQENIPRFQLVDVDCHSHQTLLSEPHVFATIAELCAQLYSEEGITSLFFERYRAAAIAVHGEYAEPVRTEVPPAASRLERQARRQRVESQQSDKAKKNGSTERGRQRPHEFEG